MSVAAVGGAILVGLATILSIQRGFRPAWLYMVFWMAYFVAGSFSMLAGLGLLPATAITSPEVYLGAIVQGLLLWMTLVHRIGVLRQQAMRAESEAQASESRLRRFLDAMPVGVTVLTPDLRIYYANQFARQIRGSPGDRLPAPAAPASEAASAVGLADEPWYVRGTSQRYPFDRLPPVRAARGEPASADDLEARFGGQRVPMEAWSTPVLDQQGHVEYVVTVSQDISERVQAEAKLRARMGVDRELAIASSGLVQRADLSRAIADTLQAIGTALGLERLLLLHSRREDARAPADPERAGIASDEGASPLAEGLAAGATPLEVIEDWCISETEPLCSKGAPVAGIPWLAETLRLGDTASWPEPVGGATGMPGKPELESASGGRRHVLPLYVGGQVDGFVAGYGLGPALIGGVEEEQVLTTMAGLLGNALHASELLQTLEERVAQRTRELRALYSIAVLAYRPLNEMLAESLAVLLPAMGVPIGMVHLRAAEHAPLALMAQHGLSTEAIAETESWLAEDKPWCRVDAAGAPLTLPCRVVAPGWIEGAPADHPTYLGVPIRIRSEIVGVLSVVGRDQVFSAEQIALLCSVADEMGAAVMGERLRRAAEDARVAQERQRLARDLHDAVTQSLYSLMLFAEAARATAQAGKAARSLEYLERIGQTAHQALKEMRLLIYHLKPPALESAGLAVALQRRLEAVEQRAGMRARLAAENYVVEPPSAVADTLYRVAQEILNNVLKHAQATEVAVELWSNGEEAGLLVRDDGRGFSPEAAVRSGGMGLVNIRQRVEEIRGQMDIMSAPGQGTEVRVRVPASAIAGHEPVAVERGVSP